MFNKNKLVGDFPWCSEVKKNPPSNSEDAGSIPGQGTKIPHALGDGGCIPQRRRNAAK